MTDTITLTGLVGTPPRHTLTSEGLAITSFRLASTQRRFDRSHNGWVDGETNWYTITAFRQLAQNINTSVSKGQRIVVTGRLRIREWVAGDKSGTNIEVDADAVGHDLSWGTSAFLRNISSAPVTVVDPAGDDSSLATGQAGKPDGVVDWGTSSLGGSWDTPAAPGPGVSAKPPSIPVESNQTSSNQGSQGSGDDDDDDDDDLEDAETDAAAKDSETVPF